VGIQDPGPGARSWAWCSGTAFKQRGLASIGALLVQLNLTPQKPLERAYRRNPEAIERWQHDTYPAIARQAHKENADIFFWDESGFRADSVHGRTWAPCGETPVVERPGERQSMSLNLDELVWGHVKRTGIARRPLTKGEKLGPRIHEQLAQIGRNPKLVRSFFRHPSVRYIS